MTPSSPGPGTVPLSQLLVESQSPPAGLIHRTVDIIVRTSSGASARTERRVLALSPDVLPALEMLPECAAVPSRSSLPLRSPPSRSPGGSAPGLQGLIARASESETGDRILLGDDGTSSIRGRPGLEHRGGPRIAEVDPWQVIKAAKPGSHGRRGGRAKGTANVVGRDRDQPLFRTRFGRPHRSRLIRTCFGRSDRRFGRSDRAPRRPSDGRRRSCCRSCSCSRRSRSEPYGAVAHQAVSSRGVGADVIPFDHVAGRAGPCGPEAVAAVGRADVAGRG